MTKNTIHIVKKESQKIALNKANKNFAREIERSIIKTYHKKIWSRFAKGVKEYQLVNEGDKIAVCISGGKDSMLMAKLFQELKRHRKCNFELEFIVMNPGYSDESYENIVKNAELMQVPITTFHSDIFEIVDHVSGSPCYLCARMRRGHLYNQAKELGCNKIALGHHFDDVIETILMGMFYGAQIQTMMPKLHSTNFEGMELIRPMYLVHEEDIIAWCNSNNLKFIQCACRFTEELHNSIEGVGNSKRQEIKMLIKELKKGNPNIDTHIFRSIENVNVDTIIGYKKNGERHSFLDDYE